MNSHSAFNASEETIEWRKQTDRYSRSKNQEPPNYAFVNAIAQHGSDSKNKDWKDRKKRIITIHVQRGHEKRAVAVLNKISRSDWAKRRFNLPLYVLPKYSKYGTKASNRKAKKAVLRTAQVRASLSEVYTTDIDDIEGIFMDEGHEHDGKTLRECILALSHPNDPNSKLFVAVDNTDYGPERVVLTYPSDYTEAETYAENITKVLLQFYGDKMIPFMSPEGLEEAYETEWDDEKNMPISPEELMFNEAMGSDMPSWVQKDFADIIEKDKAVEERPKKGGFQLKNHNDHKSVSTVGDATVDTLQPRDDQQPPYDPDAMQTEETPAPTAPPTTHVMTSTAPGFNLPPEEATVLQDEDLTVASSQLTEMDRAKIAETESKVDKLHSQMELMLQLLQGGGTAASKIPSTGETPQAGGSSPDQGATLGEVRDTSATHVVAGGEA